jgi:hypothetical protein
MGLTFATHPHAQHLTISAAGRSNSCAIINQYVDTSVKSNNITKVAYIVEATKITTPKYYDHYIQKAEFIRRSLSQMNLTTDGVEATHLQLEKPAMYYEHIYNNRGLLKISSQYSKRVEHALEVGAALSHREKRDLSGIADKLLNETSNLNKNEPMLFYKELNQFHNSPSKMFVGTSSKTIERRGSELIISEARKLVATGEKIANRRHNSIIELEPLIIDPNAP